MFKVFKGLETGFQRVQEELQGQWHMVRQKKGLCQELSEEVQKWQTKGQVVLKKPQNQDENDQNQKQKEQHPEINGEQEGNFVWER